MSEFGNFLISIFSSRARTGWILFLAGAVIVAGSAKSVWPIEGLQGWWLWTPAFAAILGAVILVVSFGEWILSVEKAARHRRKVRTAANADALQRDHEAVASLDLLSASERAALIWILRAGQQRFRGPNSNGPFNQLRQKQVIMRPPNSNASDVFWVRSVVWDRRTALMAQWENEPAPKDPPWEKARRI